MPRKIYILGPAYPFRGGIASFNERLAREFIRKSWEVKIFTFTTQYPSLIFPGKNQYSEDEFEGDLEIERAFSSVNPLSWLLLRKKIIREQPDILLSKYWLPYIGLSSAYIHRASRNNKKIRSITIVDNIIPHQHMPGDDLITRYFVNSLDLFVVMSNTVKNQFQQLYPEKTILHLAHPIYDNYGEIIKKKEACEALKIDPAFSYVLFFGFIKPYKGLDLLLESIPRKFFIENQIKLIIGGEVYGSKSKYEEIIRERDLGELILFHDRFISNEEVKYYFCAADLIAQTYHTATQSGISQLALYFEKPIIVTNVGGLAETVAHGKTGYVIEPDPYIISQCLINHFKTGHEDLLIRNIAQKKLEYSWSNFVDEIINFQ